MKSSHKLSDWHLQRAALGSVQAARESTLPCQKEGKESRGALKKERNPYWDREAQLRVAGTKGEPFFSILISELLRKHKKHLHLHIWSTRYHFLLEKRGARDSGMPSCCSCHSMLSSIIFSNRFQYSTGTGRASTIAFAILMIRQKVVFLLLVFVFCLFVLSVCTKKHCYVLAAFQTLGKTWSLP